MDRNMATGPGVLARDGSAVEFYKVLPHLGEAEIVHSCVPRGCEILELGCGAGRVTHPLLELGHSVTAVDDCEEMLAEVRGAQTVRADIAELRLGRRFPALLLMSCLFNVVDERLRGAFLRTCAAHLEPDGIAVVQCYDSRFLERAQPGPLGEGPAGVRVAWGDVRRDGNVVSGTLEYRHAGEAWTQTFAAEFFDEAQIKAQLEAAGLRLDRWIAAPNWFTARLA